MFHLLPLLCSADKKKNTSCTPKIACFVSPQCSAQQCLENGPCTAVVVQGRRDVR